MDGKQRPTKKQHELLEFVEKFVADHGYGPSYREIMSGCHYTSVATVALHVSNLINKGFLVKNGRSARSLEVVDFPTAARKDRVRSADDNEKWLAELVQKKFDNTLTDLNQANVEELELLVSALKILGFSAQAEKFAARLEKIKQQP